MSRKPEPPEERDAWALLCRSWWPAVLVSIACLLLLALLWWAE